MQPSFRNPRLGSFLALEEEVSCDSRRRVTVAPFIKGETLLAHATQAGLSPAQWTTAYQSIPALMQAIWREARSPNDQSLGLVLDHHFDNIVVGIKQPPFADLADRSRNRVIFVDCRDDGPYHCQHTLEDVIRQFRALLKEHAFVRSTWG